MAAHLIDTLNQRGLIAQITHRDQLTKHLATQSRHCYLGIDPTAASLHVGHLVSLGVARQLQQAGHRIIVVLGSATAMIGDPSGKSKARNMLTTEQIAHNTRALEQQLTHYLNFNDPQQAVLLQNSEWLSQLTYLDFLKNIGQHFSVNRMLTAECYQNRLQTSLSFLEFNYMLLQSYDFYHLNREYGVTIQLGGNDQWSHMLAGIDLIRRLISSQAYAITTPLLVNSQGEKMGKTQHGALWLDAQQCSPLEFFQYWRNIKDEDLATSFRLLTTVSDATLSTLNQLDQLSSTAINNFKVQLATELTTMVHGGTEAQKVSQAIQQLHQSASSNSTVTHQHSLANLVDPVILPTSYFNHSTELSIQEVLVAYKIVNSKKEARRLIDQHGLEIDGTPCRDPFLLISTHRLLHQGVFIKKGKKSHYLLKLTD